MKQDEFMEKLNRIFLNLDFDEKVKNEALTYISTHYSFISKVSKEVYNEEFENDSIKKKRHYTRLMILIYKMVELMDAYNEKQLPLDVMFDTLSDVTLRQRVYYEKHGKFGLNNEDIMWLRHIYKFEIFKLGSLQFEITYMDSLNLEGIECEEEAFKKVAKGVPILNVHIRGGVDFSRKAVDESFERSEKFFKKHFPHHDFKAYTCDSWMLYSGNNKILSKSSNILDFASRFEVIGETNNAEFALKYIFGGRRRAIKDYQKETNLQINALKNIKKLGVGYGILLR